MLKKNKVKVLMEPTAPYGNNCISIWLILKRHILCLGLKKKQNCFYWRKWRAFGTCYYWKVGKFSIQRHKCNVGLIENNKKTIQVDSRSRNQVCFWKFLKWINKNNSSNPWKFPKNKKKRRKVVKLCWIQFFLFCR